MPDTAEWIRALFGLGCFVVVGGILAVSAVIGIIIAIVFAIKKHKSDE